MKVELFEELKVSIKQGGKILKGKGNLEDSLVLKIQIQNKSEKDWDYHRINSQSYLESAHQHFKIGNKEEENQKVQPKFY